MGQKFVIDATLFCNLEAAGKTDELADTIDYAEVHRYVPGIVDDPSDDGWDDSSCANSCRRIQTIVEGKPCNLIEKVAQNIADEVLNLDNRIQKVQISVQKPHVAVSGVLQSLGIEITRLNPSLCNPSRKTLS